MRLTVERVEWNGGTTAKGHGTDEHGHARRFLGDWRPMREIGYALEAGEVVEVEVEDWQLLG